MWRLDTKWTARLGLAAVQVLVYVVRHCLDLATVSSSCQLEVSTQILLFEHEAKTNDLSTVLLIVLPQPSHTSVRYCGHEGIECKWGSRSWQPFRFGLRLGCEPWNYTEWQVLHVLLRWRRLLFHDTYRTWQSLDAKSQLSKIQGGRASDCLRRRNGQRRSWCECSVGSGERSVNAFSSCWGMLSMWHPCTISGGSTQNTSCSIKSWTEERLLPALLGFHRQCGTPHHTVLDIIF